ncbi:hypothetical protein ACO2IY_17655 [Leptospira interrogans]|uniref:hypothetical protein n=1 Tax=Leptospira interrogans TaxID=173 RepID=UPI00031705D0|nr:hypothetical protein [Leptospira interrogans]
MDRIGKLSTTLSMDRVGKLSTTLSMDRVGKLNTTLSMDRIGKLSTTLSMDRVVECKFYREICRNSDGFILRSKYIYKFTLELLKVLTASIDPFP